jgi:hypothetical protein
MRKEPPMNADARRFTFIGVNLRASAVPGYRDS